MFAFGGAAALQQGSKPMTLKPFSSLVKLQYLNLSNCAGFTGPLDPLRTLVNLARLGLAGCLGLDGELDALSELEMLDTLDLQACFGLSGSLDALFDLQKLLYLNVCDTNLVGVEDFPARHLGGLGKCQMGRIRTDHKTSLWFAVDDGQLETARRLIKGGSEVDRAEKDNDVTPLIQASKRGFAEIVSLLLENGADVKKSDKDGFTAMHWASYQGFEDLVASMLRQDADASQPTDNEGRTALFVASCKGYLDIVRTLLFHGADVNKPRLDGATPFFIAAQNNHTEIAKMLLEKVEDIEKGLDTDGGVQAGLTPLLVAAKSGNTVLVEELLARGADQDRRTTIAHLDIPAGSTALSVAELRGHEEVAAVLRKANAAAQRE